MKYLFQVYPITIVLGTKIGPCNAFIIYLHLVTYGNHYPCTISIMELYNLFTNCKHK